MMFVKFFKAYWRSKEAVTVIEYAMIAAGLAGVIISVVFVFGDEMVVTITQLSDTFDGADERMSTE